MKYLTVDLPLILGALLIMGPILYLMRCKIRMIRFREDIFSERDYLFDAAMEKGYLNDPAVVEADEHIWHLTRIVDILSISLLIALQSHIPDTIIRREAQDPDMQKIIDKVYLRTAQRTLNYLVNESISMRLAMALAPQLLSILKMCIKGLERLQQRTKMRKISQEEVERFVRSEVPIQMSLKMKPSNASGMLKNDHVHSLVGRA